MEDTIPGEIEHKLATIERGESRTWSQIALLLMQIEGSNYWARQASSFSEWIKKHCSRFNVKEASLWRYLAAARYYQALQNNLNTSGMAAPALVHLPNAVSPENLELLSKISRVIPEADFLELAKKVISLTIRRDELRTIWSAYRPALAGRTARGRGVNVPTIDPANLENKSTVQRGEVMTAIMYSRPGWTGINNPEWCERIAEVRPEHGKQAFDAVILVREHANDPLKIHGVLIVTDLTPETVRQCEELAPYCDTLWVAFHGRNLAMNWMFIPGFVGILCWINGNFYRERPAGNAGILGTKIGDMAKGLLLKILKR